MRQKLLGGLTDQFGQLVEPGKWYGVREASDPPSRAVAAQCISIIRERVWFRNQHGYKFDVANTPDGGGYRLHRLDENLREVTKAPREVLEKRVTEVRRMLELIAARAARRRRQQLDLMAEVAELWGCVEKGPEFADAVATFIRDDDSHVTAEALANEYRAALLGDS